jgi:large subunit ribosomal protein L4
MNQNVILSARNIQNVKTAQVNELNTYDVLKYNTVIASQAAVKKIEEVYA